jgi:hypothetical protein
MVSKVNPERKDAACALLRNGPTWGYSDQYETEPSKFITSKARVRPVVNGPMLYVEMSVNCSRK